MLDLALQIASEPETVEESDLHRARAAGLDDEELWDVAAITGLFAMSNRLAHAFAIRPNEEFHLMGRVPREPDL